MRPLSFTTKRIVNFYGDSVFILSEYYSKFSRNFHESSAKEFLESLVVVVLFHGEQLDQLIVITSHHSRQHQKQRESNHSQKIKLVK